MSRITASFDLMKASWAVLRQQRHLALYPIVSAICAIAISAIFLVPVALASTSGRQRTLPVWAYVVLFAMYAALAFVQCFFNAALIASANEHFEGRRPSFADGIRFARQRAGKIAAWALVAATVGLALRFIQERSGIIGRIVVSFIGVGWNLLTFFVVPVLVFEDVGPIEAVKRSGRLFKERWGEAVVGSTSIGLASFVVALPAIAVLVGGIILAAGGAVVPGVMLAVIAIAAIVVVSIVSSAMQQIYNTALYRFATHSQASGAFSTAQLQATFRPKTSWGRRR